MAVHQLRPVPSEPTVGDRSCVQGSDVANLIDSLERSLRIAELASKGLQHELHKQPALSPLRQYAGIQVAAWEQIQVDLLALIQAIRD